MAAVRQQFALTGSEVDQLDLRAFDGVTLPGREHQGVACGEKLRPIELRLSGFRVRVDECLGGAAELGDAQQPARGVGIEDDETVRPPGGTERVWRVAQDLGSSSSQGDLLQFALGGETEPLAVRRKEGVLRVLRAGNQQPIELAQESPIELA